MNAITHFRKCTLTNEELMQMVDQQTDSIFTLGKIPTRHIPARPNKDYDLLVGELILRFKELTEQSQLHAIMQAEGSDEMCGSDCCPNDGACEHCQNPIRKGAEGAAVASEGQGKAVCADGCNPDDITMRYGIKQCIACGKPI